MTRPTSHPPGAFAWVDVRTYDPPGAKRFYADLFGWSYADNDYGSVASVGGDAVSGLRRLGGDQPAPFWLSFVTIRDADEAATRTRELGGTVQRGPFPNVAGRMTVIADPTGGSLCLWESAEGVGACRVDEPGCLTRHELSTGDAAAARRFYAQLFSWRVEEMNVREQPGTAAHWLPYFAVTSLDDAVARATDAGGRIVNRRSRAVAVLRDPQGAEFGVLDVRAGR